MKKVDFDLGLCLRMVLRAVVLFWFYRLGEIADLVSRVKHDVTTWHGNEGWFFWIGNHQPSQPNVTSGVGFWFWSGVVVAGIVALVIEFWMKQKYKS